LVFVDGLLEEPFGGGQIGGVEDGPQIGRDLGTHRDLGDVLHGILLEVELAALPGNAREAGLPGGFEAGVIVADDPPYAVEPAGLERFEELTPMDLGLGEGDADPEDGTFSVGEETDGDEDRTVHDGAAVADFFVARVEDQVRRFSERTVASLVEFLVEGFGGPADLGTADLVAAEFLGDGGDLAGGDALDVHFGQGELQGPFAAFAPFDGLGIERDAAGHRAQAGLHGLRLEPIGIASAAFGSLVGLGMEGVRPFDLHGFVVEHSAGVGHSVKSVLGEQFQNLFKDGRMFLVGHTVLLGVE